MNRLHHGYVLGGRCRLTERIGSRGMSDLWMAPPLLMHPSAADDNPSQDR